MDGIYLNLDFLIQKVVMMEIGGKVILTLTGPGVIKPTALSGAGLPHPMSL
jgi:hypothetical protein